MLEDLLALRKHASFVQAAEARHVTRPAFGRGIRALEAWAGVPLVATGRAPVRLTPAGEALLGEAEPLLAGLARVRAQWTATARSPGGAVSTLRIGTGRTLAHTLVADWLARLRSTLRPHRVELHTEAMVEIAAVFERGEVDLLVCYEHPALSMGLSGQRFRHLTLASDRLLPVARVDANGRVRHELGGPQWIGYAPTLALGRLLADHLSSARGGLQPRINAERTAAVRSGDNHDRIRRASRAEQCSRSRCSSSASSEASSRHRAAPEAGCRLHQGTTQSCTRSFGSR